MVWVSYPSQRKNNTMRAKAVMGERAQAICNTHIYDNRYSGALLGVSLLVSLRGSLLVLTLVSREVSGVAVVWLGGVSSRVRTAA